VYGNQPCSLDLQNRRKAPIQQRRSRCILAYTIKACHTSTSSYLSKKYGRSFAVRNLRRMMQFADFEIVLPLAT